MIPVGVCRLILFPGLVGFVASALALGAVGSGAAEQLRATESTSTRVEETRLHLRLRVPDGDAAAHLLLRESGAKLPEASHIVRRWKSREGTERVQLLYLLDLGNGVRVKSTTDLDYFVCRGTELIEVIWSVDNREYVRFSQSMDGCPDHTEEGFRKKLESIVRGRSSAPASYLHTVETQQIKVTMDLHQWKAGGNSEVRDSLSPEFLEVLAGALSPLSRCDPFASGLCEKLAGLLSVKCGKGTEASSALHFDALPDCDFDASFGIPCTPEQQREYDARVGRSILSPTPTVP